MSNLQIKYLKTRNSLMAVTSFVDFSTKKFHPVFALSRLIFMFMKCDKFSNYKYYSTHFEKATLSVTEQVFPFSVSKTRRCRFHLEAT